MKFFNGFSLEGEEKFFNGILVDTDMCVAGFSYGAQKAFEYAFASKERIDRLILISPAFFQTQKPSFIKAQLRYFEADKEGYIDRFLQNVAYPSCTDLYPHLRLGTKEELETLLTYTWDKEKFKSLLHKGITIEIFLGSKDKIIDANAAFSFFSPLASTYLIKDAGHLLKG
ncbi:MAG: pimelyl-ACP methyl ester esterase BioV [Sulfurovum sp.]|jgi:pimeloyl-ACP methyl ester carboxylesterase|nr:pimelyl-ACP methyl ester esterase BioV [Sulfurovum sp.]